ncbi:MAG: methylenetetrahydrofolate reductase [NAD(P)H] [Leptonema sp. (in: bacteria)]
MQKIHTIISKKKPTFSFEFFPPKTEEGELQLQNTILQLKDLKPDFVSITYGAGGTSQIKTEAWAYKIQKELDLLSMAHLTCINASKEKILNLLKQYRENSIQNIMALRGDLPQNQVLYYRYFRYASDLISFIRLHFNNSFSIGAACYPEKHPEAKTLEEDIENLKIKVDSGADFLITQLFFDNEKFFVFRDKIKAKGISIPLIAGIMPITAYKQIEKFTKMANCKIPDSLYSNLEKYKDSEEDLKKISIEFSVNQCQELLNNGVEGVHFYTLNQSVATQEILKKIHVYLTK